MAINLFPWREFKIKRKNRWYFLTLAIGAFTVFSVIWAVHCAFPYFYYSVQNQNARLSVEIKKMHIENDKKQALNNELMIQKIQLIEMTTALQSDFWKHITFLQKNTPPDIELLELDWQPEKMRLTGETSNAKHIGDLIKILEKSLFFQNVVLETLENHNNDLMTKFSITSESKKIL